MKFRCTPLLIAVLMLLSLQAPAQKAEKIDCRILPYFLDDMAVQNFFMPDANQPVIFNDPLRLVKDGKMPRKYYLVHIPYGRSQAADTAARFVVTDISQSGKTYTATILYPPKHRQMRARLVENGEDDFILEAPEFSVMKEIDYRK